MAETRVANLPFSPQIVAELVPAMIPNMSVLLNSPMVQVDGAAEIAAGGEFLSIPRFAFGTGSWQRLVEGTDFDV